MFRLCKTIIHRGEKGMENKTANILGVNYTIIYSHDEKEYPLLAECNGYTDFTIKTILVRDHWDSEEDGTAMKDLDVLIKKITRHEIIHAFLYESGLSNNSKASDCWADNEEMVDWIAIQFPKMTEIFEQIGVLK